MQLKLYEQYVFQGYKVIKKLGMSYIYLYIYIIIIITNLKLTKMKISELIAKLEIIKERSGDTELTFKVKDGYDRYGYDMDFDLRVGGYNW